MKSEAHRRIIESMPTRSTFAALAVFGWVVLALATTACPPEASDARRHYKGPDGLEWFESNCGGDLSYCREDAGQFCHEAGYVVGDVTDDGNVVAAPVLGAYVARKNHDYTMTFRCRQPSEQVKP